MTRTDLIDLIWVVCLKWFYYLCNFSFLGILSIKNILTEKLFWNKKDYLTVMTWYRKQVNIKVVEIDM